ncbi:hypothetical protein HanXRQr2_Chr17g0782761 [Helianthus annuus]|uniref:Uncharacterized protein n=1 Tax=Helianthus annuus TaxID=4232 RepID=A0A9K3GSY9_HELAN|nr:hypothetical protein HanXRQr2_Chr17g0782761 [Helianthus annuus]
MCHSSTRMPFHFHVWLCPMVLNFPLLMHCCHVALNWGLVLLHMSRVCFTILFPLI